MYILKEKIDTYTAVVTFECFVWVWGKPDSQAETDPRGAACDKHHLFIHGA